MIRSPLAVGTLALLLGFGVWSAPAAAQPAEAPPPSIEEPVDPYAPAEPAPTPIKPPAAKAKPQGQGKNAKAAPAAPAPPAPAPADVAPAPPASPSGAAPAAPSDPPGAPAASSSPAVPDPAAAQLAEEIAFSLTARAQQLLDNKQYADAKQLATEAIARSPRGVAAERAQLILRAANTALGIATPAPPPVESVPEDPYPEPPDAPAPASGPVEGSTSARTYALVHTSLYGGLVGATLGSLVDDSVAVEAGVGAVGAAAGAYFLPRLLTRRYDAEQIRTVGSASLWGGVVGGLLADVTTSLDDTSPRQVLLGATLGATVTTAGGLLLTRSRPFTHGDVLLTDTLAAMGATGGLTLGLAMQPFETEGYSLNAALGVAAGVAVGMVAAPQIDATPKRVAYIAGGAAAGAAAPWLLYLLVADGDTNNDEQAFGLVSTAGMLAGAYLGLRWSRHLIKGQDVHERSAAADDAPPALLRRSSTGSFAFGGPSLRASQQAPERAYVVDVLAGRF
jgi:hypothetical protein